MKKILGIYVHIPFCMSKCKYCDFISFQNIEEKEDEYINCIIKEIENANWEKINNNYNVTTIYIGGGTPSYLNEKNIEKIINLIKQKIRYNETNKIEITIEINPGTVTEQKLLKYKSIGINRISIGLQSTNDYLLKNIGRIHNYEQFLVTYKLARKIGFTNINVDLMLGLPEQTIEHLKQSLDDILLLNPNHISVYSLILEEKTPLFELVNQGKVKLPDEELERQMYWYVKNKLELAGYNHYEISNFAKKQNESKHNLNCWNQEEYLGFGLAAHSYYGDKRYSNINDLNKYIENIKNNKFEKNIIVHEIQKNEDKQKEFMLLGLRKIEGVSISTFKEKFVENPIYIFKNELLNLTEQGLLEIDGDKIRLTNKGLDFANIVWEEFV